MRFVIAGGGTGGHLFPALAVAEVMQEKGNEVLIFISEKEVDALATKDRGEFRFEKLPTIGMPRFFSPAIIGFLKRFTQSLAPCRETYKKFQPDGVLAMGGFTSTAPILAAKLAKIPTFLHESNAIPGKANRLNAKMADMVLLGFQQCARFFPKARCEVTGTPIRRKLMQKIEKEKALEAFGFRGDWKTLLVMGGSQGAHGINEAMIKAMALLKDMPLQVLHLTGAKDEQLVTANYRRENIPSFVAAFHHRMEEAYSVADCAIARSGAASLAELSHFGIPSILIPYPWAAENHQALNAEIFDCAGAAAVLMQSETTGEKLAEKVRELLEDPARLHAMSKHSRQLSPGDAARQVVEIIEKNCNDGYGANTRGDSRGR
jgi:UDP-N-acetylglucosamine--N-acetylmuramyl-(pentapeptide) pyrophosphoryl-undecaprenol N-acetylglucosamine transferase